MCCRTGTAYQRPLCAIRLSIVFKISLLFRTVVPQSGRHTQKIKAVSMTPTPKGSFLPGWDYRVPLRPPPGYLWPKILILGGLACSISSKVVIPKGLRVKVFHLKGLASGLWRRSFFSGLLFLF